MGSGPKIPLPESQCFTYTSCSSYLTHARLCQWQTELVSTGLAARSFRSPHRDLPRACAAVCRQIHLPSERLRRVAGRSVTRWQCHTSLSPRLFRGGWPDQCWSQVVRGLSLECLQVKAPGLGILEAQGLFHVRNSSHG